jgi:glycosyltransferase involved in cell wall biosynthesis
MVKNEAVRIERTLQAVADQIDQYVILDTGSTDETIDVIKRFCHQHKKTLKLDTLPFVDFSHNRNHLMKMCYGLSHFVLLMDANEEVRNLPVLVSFLKRRVNKREVAYSNRYLLENDAGIKGNNLTFYKICVIRNDVTELHWEFPVHEYLIMNRIEEMVINQDLMHSEFYFYQNRDTDRPSVERYPNDIKVLLKYLDKHGPDMRIYRYLIQSYDGLAEHTSAIVYCDKQIELCEKMLPVQNMYNDDYYRALLIRGRSLGILDQPDFYLWLLKAQKHGRLLYSCIEPLILIVQVYLKRRQNEQAWLYLLNLCAIEEPKGDVSGALVNYDLYRKIRWELLKCLSEAKGDMENYYRAIRELQEGGTLPP